MAALLSGKNPSIHRILGWLNPKAGLAILCKKKISCPFKDWNRRLSNLHPSHYTDCTILAHALIYKQSNMLKWHVIKSEFFFLISNTNQAGCGGNALDLHLEGTCFYLSQETGYPDSGFSWVFLSAQATGRILLWLGQEYFLPNPSKVIVQRLSYHFCNTDRALK